MADKIYIQGFPSTPAKEWQPKDFFQAIRATAALRRKSLPDSTALFEALYKVNPDHGQIFTELSINYLLHSGHCTEREGTVSANLLGKYGRWGNQIAQYCLARALSRRLGLNLSIRDWIGNYIFGLPSIDHGVDDLEVATKEIIDNLLDNKIHAFNFDIGNYIVDFEKLNEERAFFSLELVIDKRLPVVSDLQKAGFYESARVVAHLRLGDLIKTESERALALTQFNQIVREHIQDESVWLISDSLESIEPLAKELNYRLLPESILTMPKLKWLYEWQMLREASIRFSNLSDSTFFTSARYLGSEAAMSIAAPQKYQSKT